MKFRLSTGVALLVVLLASLVVRAELPKQDREAAKRMIAGTLYLRLDVPLKHVPGAFGWGPEAVLEVSPTGHDTSRILSLPIKHPKRVKLNFVFYPNYPVRFAKLLFNGDKISVWAEGVSPHEYEIMIDFIQINSLDDFTKAFNQTFSKVPLQEEHPEWPSDVRSGIAEHKLVVGMTKDQAFAVVGTPLETETEEENGVKVETWSPRQDAGTIGVRKQEKNMRTGFPALLKFTDGKLQTIEQAPKIPDPGAK
ncbi:MAG TPA: hypothetical protein VJP02_12890 [Candidatus Sulfotelmatobacter sp.]|nr:hypothetical protein [Candidatus Sulfotelmatobacter sp.]